MCAAFDGERGLNFSVAATTFNVYVLNTIIPNCF